VGENIIEPFTLENHKPRLMNSAILDDILKELKRAKKKHPNWPDHIVARAAIVGEEAGELIRASLNYKYEKSNAEDQLKEMQKEAVQTAATAIRFLESLKSI
jgi:NTP pyrophosphatase (non-canonical NTP hydrolase)